MPRLRDSPDLSGRIGGGGLEPIPSDILTMNVSDCDPSKGSSVEVSSQRHPSSSDRYCGVSPKASR